MTLDTNAIFPELYVALGLSGLKNGASTSPLVLSSLCTHLDRVVQKNEKSMDVKRTKEIVTVFHGLSAPELSIRMYLERIFKYSKCSPSCFVLANIYIDRFLQRPDVHLTSLNVHRLLITSVVIAAKFIDDAFFSNAYYAKVGGVTTREMNKLELNFLFSLDFRLQVSPETFSRYCIQLEREGSGVQVERVERPVQVCGPKDWTNKDDSKCQPPLHRYSY